MLPNELRSLIVAYFPVYLASPKRRSVISERAVLTDVMFELKTGIRWE